MERNYDEVISEMLIGLEQIHARGEKLNKRLDLTIKRMVKAESRLEDVDKKLELSIKDQRSQSQLQAKANAFFQKQLLNKENY